MRLPDASLRRTPLKFNITPMIDVVFLLIIFFLVASYFIRSEQSRQVTLPVASKGQPDDISSPHRLTITIEPDGQLSVAGTQMSENQILKLIDELIAYDCKVAEIVLKDYGAQLSSDVIEKAVEALWNNVIGFRVRSLFAPQKPLASAAPLWEPIYATEVKKWEAAHLAALAAEKARREAEEKAKEEAIKKMAAEALAAKASVIPAQFDI